MKWVVYTDTICTGLVSDKDEDVMILYDSEDEAARECMDVWVSFDEGLLGGEVKRLLQSGTAREIEEWRDKQDDDFDDHNMGWMKADDFTEGWKCII